MSVENVREDDKLDSCLLSTQSTTSLTALIEFASKLFLLYTPQTLSHQGDCYLNKLSGLKKYSRVSFGCGGADAAELFGLFVRSLETIDIGYCLQYIRKFGFLSKNYVRKHVHRSLNPKLFDFIRYEAKTGIRPLPSILSHPHYLSSYVFMLPESFIKSALYNHLKKYKQLPSYPILENNIVERCRTKEGISPPKNSNCLADPSTSKRVLNIGKNDIYSSHMRHKNTKTLPKGNMLRSDVYELILKSEYVGIPYEDMINSDASVHPNGNENDNENQTNECYSIGGNMRNVSSNVYEKMQFMKVADVQTEQKRMIQADENCQKNDCLSISADNKNDHDGWWKNGSKSFVFKDRGFSLHYLSDGKWHQKREKKFPRARRRHKSHLEIRERRKRRKKISREIISAFFTNSA